MKRQTKQRISSAWSLMHWGLLTTLVLGIGTLVTYVITRDSIVLSWTTGILGTVLGAVVGSAHNKSRKEPLSIDEE